MAMGKNKRPIYEIRGVNMENANGAGFKATAMRLIGATPRSRGLNSLRHLPLAQVSKLQPPISRKGDGITPLHYGYPAALTRNNALNTSTFKTSPPLLEEEQSMEVSVAGFENRMTEEDREVEQFFALSPFDEPFTAIDKKQQVPVISPYESLDCAYTLNGSTPFPWTLLCDNLYWLDLSHCIRSEKTPPPLPTTTSPSECLRRTGSARGLRSGNIRAQTPTPLPRGSYTPYHPIAYGHVQANGQGPQNMVPPVPRGYLPSGSPSSWSQNRPPLVPSVGRPYHHGYGTRPPRSPSYPSVRPSRNIPPAWASSRRVTQFSKQ